MGKTATVFLDAACATRQIADIVARQTDYSHDKLVEYDEKRVKRPRPQYALEPLSLPSLARTTPTNTYHRTDLGSRSNLGTSIYLPSLPSPPQITPSGYAIREMVVATLTTWATFIFPI